ncbi:MAG: WYL domain-containing protein [Cyanobacteria bacterium HKST-UBA05]|nr:WYL domain-containing protein [Cyanobacteria bacterium HKST-UBA05]
MSPTSLPGFNSQPAQQALYDSGNFSGKIHISAFRILFLLKLLCQSSRVSIIDINNHLNNHPLIGRTFVAETLQKHLHTIGLTGFDIQRLYKEGQWYIHVQGNPLKFQFSQQDYQMLLKLVFMVRSRPIFGEYQKLVSLLELISNKDVVSQLTSPSKMVMPSLGHGHDPELVKKIETLERMIHDNQVIEFRLHRSAIQSGQVGQSAFEEPATGHGRLVQSAQLVHLEPLQLMLMQNRVCLVGINTQTNQKSRFFVDQLDALRQLPTRSRSRTILTSVHFTLSGRLARSYHRYPNEQIKEAGGDQLRVVHTTDDIEALFPRLLKYGPSCEVVSPKWVRDAVAAMIKRRIELLDAPLNEQLLGFVSKQRAGLPAGGDVIPGQTTANPHK